MKKTNNFNVCKIYIYFRYFLIILFLILLTMLFCVCILFFGNIKENKILSINSLQTQLTEKQPLMDSLQRQLHDQILSINSLQTQ
ncbi:MAG: hypothetical protein Q8888_02290, partial [Vigna little leaf phytoplasma]|nr:hypothetical protein [Vigna little leaf phytoplasma]